jgi:transposase
MQHTDLVFIGVDVAKATLSACRHGTKQLQGLANEQSAVQAWLDSLPRQALIAMESTGRYQQLLARLAHASGRRVYVLNAQDVFFYAKGLGARGKTDRKDARVIARYLAEHYRELKAWAPASSSHEQLRELLRCRAGVADKRASLRQLLREVADLDGLRLAIERQLDQALDAIDAKITALLSQDAALERRCRQLRTITGIGPQGSAMLGCLFSRIDFASADAVVAYSGFDPRPHDSGEKSGRRRISKRGSPELRRQLYLAAFAASHSKALGPLYRSLKDRGFKATQALVILARKLLRVAWAVWRTGQDFDASLIGAVAACRKT